MRKPPFYRKAFAALPGASCFKKNIPVFAMFCKKQRSTKAARRTGAKNKESATLFLDDEILGLASQIGGDVFKCNMGALDERFPRRKGDMRRGQHIGRRKQRVPLF